MLRKPAFLEKVFQLATKAGVLISHQDAQLIALTEGGSDRQFYRITDGKVSLVIMVCLTPRYDIESYLSVGKFLFEHGIGVPRIYGCDDTKQTVLLEDLGDNSMLKLLKEATDKDKIKAYYQQVLASLAEIQIKTKNDLDDCGYLRGRCFGYEAFRWETDYFAECFLKRFCGVVIDSEKELEQEFHMLAASLECEPRYFMHRDFQSQNIYFKEGKPRFIDFQTATKGLLQYDTVSLLKDAYFALDENTRGELLDFYLKTLASDRDMDIDQERFIRTFHRTGLQRNMQALGAFAYLSQEKGKQQFAAHIPNALFYLTDALSQFPEFPLLTELVEKAAIQCKAKNC